MSWSARYIGLPWAPVGRDAAGVDCWGLVRLVYRHEAGIELPSYAQACQSPEERAEVAALVERTVASPFWKRVSAPAHPLDLIVFRVGRHDSHIGIAIGEDGLMLHVSRGTSARIESWRSGYWHPRITGFVRYAELDR